MDTPLRIQILKTFQANGALDANDLISLTELSSSPVYRSLNELGEDGYLVSIEGTRPLARLITEKGLDLIEREGNKGSSSDPEFIAKRESAVNSFLF